MPSKFLQSMLIVLLGGLVLICLFAPWHQSEPSDSGLVIRSGRAPIWTLPRADGASLDLSKFTRECAVVAAVSLLVGILNRHGD
jgi:hypothetical protein